MLEGTASAKLVWLPLSRDQLALCWDVMLTSRTRGRDVPRAGGGADRARCCCGAA